MKTYFLLIAVLVSVRSAAGQSAKTPLTPAQEKIAWAEKAIAKNSANYEAYNNLALALARRARETSDPAWYAKAEKALADSLRLAPENFEGLKARVWILLGKHEFTRALEEARALNRRAPDDVMVYGFLVDANLELGDYPDAEKAAQWMLDLRPGNIPGLTRAAYLRELYGDFDGAVELMGEAYRETPPSEVEDCAWILTQIGHLELAAGKVDVAEKTLLAALELFPGYHYALGNLAKVRLAQERYPEAADLLRRRVQASPHAENFYELAEALERAGRSDEAKSAYAEFEGKARAEMEKADNANRELIFYYADHAGRPAEALRIAGREVGRRRDVSTLDAYAWALHANGQYPEARRQIEAALAVGTRNAEFFYHAGALAAELDDQAAAAHYLKESLELDPHSRYATAARAALARLAPASTEVMPR